MRLAISCVAYLIKCSRIKKEKTKGKAIVGTVMNIIIIRFSLLPALIFTGYTGLKTTGQYKVKETLAILIDNSSLYMELASNGYVVASIDHPYYTFFTKDTK